MTYEETVIESMQFLKIAHDGGLDAAAKAQAEISFKLGATQAIAKTIKPAKKLYEKAKQEGRKEVVDYMKRENLYIHPDQLKEWGIE